MVRFMENKKALRGLIQKLKDGGFTVINSHRRYQAQDDDDTEVMVDMRHRNGLCMHTLHNHYFDKYPSP